ncbi:hypothetical protein C8J57DRAFT_1527033 [Mycena rebaudengoi]|nr:hypothetical protein C8J57DRAFT_1527033 [Mycena rebaudengoi]
MPLASTTVLPVEVWANIFSLSITDAITGSCSGFVDVRHNLILVCQAWAAIVIGTPLLWSTVYVSLACPLDVLIIFLERSIGCPLDIRLDFVSRRPMPSPGRSSVPRLSHARTMAAIDSRISIVVPEISRWRSFSVDCSGPALFLRVRESLLPVFATPIQHFAILSPYYPYSTDQDPFKGLNWFSPSTMTFRSLRIRFVSFPWKDMLLHRLTRLELESIPAKCCPSVSDYAFIVGDAPHLEYLRLRWVGCRELKGTDTYSPIVSTSLRELELGFGNDRTLGFLVPLFQFPGLISVRVRLLTLWILPAAVTALTLFGDMVHWRIPLLIDPRLSHIFKAVYPGLIPFDFESTHRLSFIRCDPALHVATPSDFHLLLHPSDTPSPASAMRAHFETFTLSARLVDLVLPLELGILHPTIVDWLRLHVPISRMDSNCWTSSLAHDAWDVGWALTRRGYLLQRLQ